MTCMKLFSVGGAVLTAMGAVAINTIIARRLRKACSLQPSLAYRFSPQPHFWRFASLVGHSCIEKFWGDNIAGAS